MYAGLAGGNLRDELAQIRVDPIPNRIGHYLANELIFDFNGSGSQVPPRYALTIAVRETVQTPLVDTISGRATAGTVVTDASYKLVSLGDGREITHGAVFMTASYDRTTQRFADTRAARDAEIRDAKALADQIQTRIAAAMATH